MVELQRGPAHSRELVRLRKCTLAWTIVGRAHRLRGYTNHGRYSTLAGDACPAPGAPAPTGPCAWQTTRTVATVDKACHQVSQFSHPPLCSPGTIAVEPIAAIFWFCVTRDSNSTYQPSCFV